MRGFRGQVVRVLGVSVLCAWIGQGIAAEHFTPSAKRITEFVNQLGSPKFHDREAATEALESIGAAALGELRLALRRDDLEIARRAAELIEKIGKRQEADQLLAGRKVHLRYQDTPVAEAVSDFARKTGIAISLEGDVSKVKNRRVSVDTGETTFWDALDKFASRAGLVEVSGIPMGAVNRQTFDANRRIFIQRESNYAPVNTGDGRLILVDGKARELPTHYAGALRIRLCPSTPNGPKNPSEIVVGLEITPEPALGWQGVLDVHVDRAIDEQGQALCQSFPASSQEYDARAQMIAMGAVPKGLEPGIPAWVRLKMADQPSRTIKELTGHLTVQMQTPSTQLLTVENVLGSAGQSITGNDGTSLKVIEARRLENGMVRVRAQFESLAQGVIVWNPMPGAMRGGRGFMGGQPTPTVDYSSWALVDDKDQNFRVVSIDSPFNGGANWFTQELRMLFQPNATQGNPSKLVFSARRNVILDVPFTLKDVPAP